MGDKITIGNDIVDRNTSELGAHGRFPKRVLSPQEQEFLTEDPDAIWQFWAAKEAAYKAIKRIAPTTIFSPRTFEFSPKEGSVRFQDISLYCRFIEDPEYIAVVCSNSPELLHSQDLHNWVGTVEEWNLNASRWGTPKRGLESRAVREMAASKISSIINIATERLDFDYVDVGDQKLVGLSKPRIPTLTIDDTASDDLLSFSHHGRFILASFVAGRHISEIG